MGNETPTDARGRTRTPSVSAGRSARVPTRAKGDARARGTTRGSGCQDYDARRSGGRSFQQHGEHRGRRPSLACSARHFSIVGRAHETPKVPITSETVSALRGGRAQHLAARSSRIARARRDACIVLSILIGGSEGERPRRVRQFARNPRGVSPRAPESRRRCRQRLRRRRPVERQPNSRAAVRSRTRSIIARANLSPRFLASRAGNESRRTPLALVGSANAATLSPGTSYNLDYTETTTPDTTLSGHIDTIKTHVGNGEFGDAYTHYDTNVKSFVTGRDLLFSAIDTLFDTHNPPDAGTVLPYAGRQIPCRCQGGDRRKSPYPSLRRSSSAAS